MTLALGVEAVCYGIVQVENCIVWMNRLKIVNQIELFYVYFYCSLLIIQ